MKERANTGDGKWKSKRRKREEDSERDEHRDKEGEEGEWGLETEGRRHEKNKNEERNTILSANLSVSG